MKVTIDEARVGKQPILKIDGIELANIVNGYTLHHDAGQPATLELRIAFGADLSEIEALIENPNVKIIMPEEEPHVISIHALREEGDSKNRDKSSIFKQIIQHSARI